MRPFEGAAWHYAEYRYRPSDAFLRLVGERLGWSTTDRVLDLGAGPAQVSIGLAPLVGEVVAMDPEPAMLEEGRRRASVAGAHNVEFVEGGSDDLSSELGTFAAVVISQAFHRMPGQDAVLRALDPLLDRRRGSVAILGYVKEPDYDWWWLERPPWNAVERIARGYVGEPSLGGGPHDPFPDILGRSPFSRTELLTYEHEVVVEPSVERALGLYYSLGSFVAKLGDRRDAFEAEVRAELDGADASPLRATLVDGALLGLRPSTTPRDCL